MSSKAAAVTFEVTAPKRAWSRKKIWIDLDNSPHVPFFRPILDELKRRDHDVLVTARDAYQVRELLEYYGVSGKVIGRHHGKHKVMKSLGTCWRAVELYRYVRKEKPHLSLCHGSRGCLLASAMLGIPNVTLIDYEFTQKIPTVKPAWLIVPSVVPDDEFGVPGSRILKYPGIKEDVYLSGFRPDQGLRGRLGIGPEDLMVMVRPPATEAHYHNPESEPLLHAVLGRFVGMAHTRVVLLPRNKRQESDLRAAWQSTIESGKLVIPDRVEDGLNLIWNSDLVISGGGTMNREAAAMGVPVYSIFRGRIGAVDRYLAAQGRLVLIESEQDVQTKIKPERRHKVAQRANRHFGALESIVQNIESILATESQNSKVAQTA